MDYKIIAASQQTLILDNSKFLDIEFQITDLVQPEGEEQQEVVLETRKRAFPLDTPAEDIQAALSKEVETYISDRDSTDRTKQEEELSAQADETINQLLSVEAPEKKK